MSTESKYGVYFWRKSESEPTPEQLAKSGQQPRRVFDKLSDASKYECSQNKSIPEAQKDKYGYITRRMVEIDVIVKQKKMVNKTELLRGRQ